MVNGGERPFACLCYNAAIAYYLDHKDEIDGEIENSRRFYEQQKAKTPSLVQQSRCTSDL